MFIKIIGSFLIIGFFLFLNKLGDPFLEKGTLLSKIFPIASISMATFLIALVFLG